MVITVGKLMKKVKKLSYSNRVKIFGTAHNGVISTMIALNKEYYNKILNE